MEGSQDGLATMLFFPAFIPDSSGSLDAGTCAVDAGKNLTSGNWEGSVGVPWANPVDGSSAPTVRLARS